MPWLWHLLTAFVHPLCYSWIRKQDLSLHTFNTRQSTEWLLWAEDKMLTNIQTLYNCQIQEHAHRLCTERFLQETHNTWGVFSPQLTLWLGPSRESSPLSVKAVSWNSILSPLCGSKDYLCTSELTLLSRNHLSYSDIFISKNPQHWKVVN